MILCDIVPIAPDDVVVCKIPERYRMKVCRSLNDALVWKPVDRREEVKIEGHMLPNEMFDYNTLVQET
jgi:hypothetical protein